MWENRNRMKNELERLGFAAGELFIAENYPEAVGIMTALGKGAALSSVRRPIGDVNQVVRFEYDVLEHPGEVAEVAGWVSCGFLCR